MGRSHGGLTTQIDALLDASGRPIRLKLPKGKDHDSRSGADMVGAIGTGQTLLAGTSCDSDGLCDSLAAHGAAANIRRMSTRRCVPVFDPALDRRPKPY